MTTPDAIKTHLCSSRLILDPLESVGLAALAGFNPKRTGCFVVTWKLSAVVAQSPGKLGKFLHLPTASMGQEGNW